MDGTVYRIAFILICSLACGLARADTLVIDNVNVIDLDDGSAQAGHAVVIVDGRIRALGAVGASVPEPHERVDGGGGWLIPGLAEMHAHVPSKARGEQYARDVLTLFLANGVTTIRGMLGEPWHLELRGHLAQADWFGPRLVTSGPSFNGNTVDSPQQGAARVRDQAAAGYDFIKIHPGLSRAEFQAVAAAAHAAGLPIAGHVSFETGLEAALAAGQDTIDHLDAYAEALVPPGSELAGVEPRFFGFNLGAAIDPGRIPALAQATAAAGVWVVPTQSLFETAAGGMSVDALLKRPGMHLVGPELTGRWRDFATQARNLFPVDDRRRLLAARRELIRALQNAGAGILLGSDAPQVMNVPGYSVHQELAYLTGAGLTALEALRTGTVNVARFFGHEDQGRVAAGYVADLVLLERNPLEDIAATTAIAGVVRGGRWHGRAELDARLAEIEKRGL